MAIEIKFCGMTRVEDAGEAATLGAAYVGVIFAGGPRHLTFDRAEKVLADLPGNIRRVGVFATDDAGAVARIAEPLALDVVQLHGAHDATSIAKMRRRFKGEVWSVIRIADAELPPNAGELFNEADAVLLDAKVPGTLGGSGVTLPWQKLVERLGALRDGARARLVLAGGLRAENVGEAIRLLRPGIVDVSSGVETAPGIKDHARMRAFRDAVHAST